MEQRFIKLVVPVLQIMPILRVICYAAENFLLGEFEDTSDIRHKNLVVSSNHFKSSFRMFQSKCVAKKKSSLSRLF